MKGSAEPGAGEHGAEEAGDRRILPRRLAASRTTAYWLVLFLAVWWILADPRPGAWLGAAAAVGAGGLLHAAFGRGVAPRLRLRGVLAFVPYFALESVRGGLDVSRRALHPGLPLAPDLISFEPSLPPGPPRVFLASVMSLLPGTLSARIGDDDIAVHLLSRDEGAEARLRRLERRVAAIFGDEGSEAGDEESEAGDAGSEAGDAGSEAGDEGSEAGDEGSEAGDPEARA